MERSSRINVNPAEYKECGNCISTSYAPEASPPAVSLLIFSALIYRTSKHSQPRAASFDAERDPTPTHGDLSAFSHADVPYERSALTRFLCTSESFRCITFLKAMVELHEPAGDAANVDRDDTREHAAFQENKGANVSSYAKTQHQGRRRSCSQPIVGGQT